METASRHTYKQKKLKLIGELIQFEEGRQQSAPTDDWYGKMFDSLYDVSLSELESKATIRKWMKKQ